MTIQPYEEKTPIHKIILNADKIFVAGNRLKKELQELGHNEENLIVTGNPKFDSHNKIKNMIELNQINNTNPISKKLVVIANTRWNDWDIEIIPEIIRYCNENNLDIIVKAHPVYKKWKHDLHQEMIKKIDEKCKGLTYEISIDVKLTELLPKTSILLTEYSWAGFEASLFDIPIVVTNFAKINYSSYSLVFHKEKIALYAESLKEVFDCIDKILHDKKIQRNLEDARKKLNYDFNYLNDGNAAKRIHQIITSK